MRLMSLSVVSYGSSFRSRPEHKHPLIGFIVYFFLDWVKKVEKEKRAAYLNRTKRSKDAVESGKKYQLVNIHAAGDIC